MRVPVLVPTRASVENGVVMVLTPVLQAPDGNDSVLPTDRLPSSPNLATLLTPASWKVEHSVELYVCGVTAILDPHHQRLLSSILLIPVILYCVWNAPREAALLFASIATTIGAYEFSWLAFRITRRVELYYQHYEQFLQATRHLHGNIGDEEVPSFEEIVVDPQKCVVSLIARRFFKGNAWFAALTVAIPAAVIIAIVDSELLQLADHSLKNFSGWLFLLTARYVVVVCSLFAPNLTWMGVLIWQSEIFSIMAVRIQFCPVAAFACAGGSSSSLLMTIFEVGFVGILFYCAVMEPSPVVFIIQATFAVTGYVVVHGLGLSLISLLDSNHLEQSRNVLVFVLTLTWVAQTTAYGWKTLLKPWWGHSTPLQTRISSDLDMEGLIVSMGGGVFCAMVMVNVVELPGGGPVEVSVLLSSIGIGGMYLGELLVELWARAARVRFTGNSLPGNRGFLERTLTLTFCTVVWLAYFAAQAP